MLGIILNGGVQILESTGFFNKIYAIADRVTDGDRITPAYYNSQGQYQNIEYDTSNGMCYFRKNGKVSVSEVTDNSLKLTSCPDILYRVSYPVTLVAFIPKSKADCDKAFADDFFANEIIANLTNTTLTNVIPARSIKFISTGYESDNLIVLKKEYSKPPTDINYNFSYLSVDFNIDMIIDRACISQCEHQPENFTFITMSRICELIGNCPTILNLIEEVNNISVGAFTELTYTGVVNGINDTFVFSDEPKQVFVEEGLMKKNNPDPDGYTQTGASIVFVTPPPTGSIIRGFK